MIGFGLIGAGRIGALHAENIARGAKTNLVLVHDPVDARAAEQADRYGAAIATRPEDVFDSGEVSAVAICAPTDTHVDLIGRAALAGKAVFCEKPIDLDLERVHACLRTLRQNPVPFTIGFHRRFDPHHLALRDAVSSGALGRIEQVRLVSRDPSPPPMEYIRRSGGIFRDMMIHDLDQMRFLLGEPLVGVFARGEVMVDPSIGDVPDYDTATAMFWAAGGATVTIQNCRRSSYGFDQRVEIFGSNGTVAMDNVRLTQTEFAGGGGYLSPKLPEHFPQRYSEAYRNEMAAFADAVECGRTPEPTAEDGLLSLVLADAAAESANTGRAVEIDVPVISG